MKLGEKLRLLRKKKGWSQTKLAMRAAIHPNEIGFYETGLRRCNVDNLRRLCNALGVTLGAFHNCEPDRERDAPFVPEWQPLAVDEFRCGLCDKVFKRTNTDKEARKELRAYFGPGYTPKKCIMVCNGCMERWMEDYEAKLPYNGEKEPQEEVEG